MERVKIIFYVLLLSLSFNIVRYFPFKLCSWLIWLLFIVSLFILSFGISWQISKQADFFYSTWYEILDIDETINTYVKRNRQGKTDFPIEDKQLHQKLFAEIVVAIHQQGQLLTQIAYRNQLGHYRQLLTANEVIHLQDVAQLITNLRNLWRWNLGLLIVLTLAYFAERYIRQKSLKQTLAIRSNYLLMMPDKRHKKVILVTFMVLITIIMAGYGFTEVFYYLHTLIFPEGHQWFFYYEDSLMTTIMKAPDIFAAIALQLCIFALLIAYLYELGLGKFLAIKR